MKLILAPMEGVVDHALREILTAVGGYDHCVTEFLRVTRGVHQPRAFLRNCPELAAGARTAAGAPVHLQLLGGDPEMVGLNAARAAELGAPAVDLNFGCPAKTVNRHDGGAVLLKNPNRVGDVVRAARGAAPAGVPVSAKLRLGYEDPSLAVENALAAQEGGAAWVTVHARTKRDGYRPPADWAAVGRIRLALRVPVVANGDVFTVGDYFRIREATGCEDVMLGRGAVAAPDLARRIRARLAGGEDRPMAWPEALGLVRRLHAACSREANPEYALARVKQWTRLLGAAHPQAAALFQALKRHANPADFAAELARAWDGTQSLTHVNL